MKKNHILYTVVAAAAIVYIYKYLMLPFPKALKCYILYIIRLGASQSLNFSIYMFNIIYIRFHSEPLLFWTKLITWTKYRFTLG